MQLRDRRAAPPARRSAAPRQHPAARRRWQSAPDQLRAGGFQEALHVLHAGIRLEHHQHIGRRSRGAAERLVLGRSSGRQHPGGQHDDHQRLRRNGPAFPVARAAQPVQHGRAEAGRLGHSERRLVEPRHQARQRAFLVQCGRQRCCRFDQAALPGQFGAAPGTVAQMSLHALSLAVGQRAGGIPGQQCLHVLVLRNVRWVLHVHLNSSKWSDNMSFKRRRAWNMRVFTVFTGQPMVSAISW